MYKCIIYIIYYVHNSYEIYMYINLGIMIYIISVLYKKGSNKPLVERITVLALGRSLFWKV